MYFHSKKVAANARASAHQQVLYHLPARTDGMILESFRKSSGWNANLPLSTEYSRLIHSQGLVICSMAAARMPYGSPVTGSRLFCYSMHTRRSPSNHSLRSTFGL